MRFIRRWKWTITSCVLVVVAGACIAVITGRWYASLLALAYAAAVVFKTRPGSRD